MTMTTQTQTAVRRRDAAVPAQARYRLIASPFGAFALVERPDGALATGWVEAAGELDLDDMTADRSLLPELAARLVRYFRGDIVDFSDVPTPLASGPASTIKGSPFHRRCWEACRSIPRGQTISYAELAVRAGSTRNASRAAGQAMRRNPLPIIVPCHRVIGADGRLHGFGGSTDPTGRHLGTKRGLLELERAPTPTHGRASATAGWFSR
jgi:methylated-DNA-[protein]-cysteine S-methyltransferase